MRRVLFAVLGLLALLPAPDLAAIGFTGEAPAPDQPLTLWYRRPAEQWTEALPIGNGRLGAMVFGGVDEERLQLNEDTLWAGGPYDPVNPEAPGALCRRCASSSSPGGTPRRDAARRTHGHGAAARADAATRRWATS